MYVRRLISGTDEHPHGCLQFGVDVHILYVIRRLTELLESPLIQVRDRVAVNSGGGEAILRPLL